MTAAPQYNPALLKVELCRWGVRLDASIEAQTDAVCTPAIDEHTGAAIELVLADDLWATVAIGAPGESSSPFVLAADGEHFVLRRDAVPMDVRVVGPPAFYQRLTSGGRRMQDVARAYGSCIVINPAAACGYTLRGQPCAFCRDGTRLPIPSFYGITPQEVTDTVGAAFEEGVGEFVYFNVGHFDGEDGGIEFLEPYIRAVKRHFDTLVAVQLHPPRTNAWINRTYAMGVDALSYGVEVHDAAILAARCPGRVQHIGRERFYEALQYAATVFPSGTVWSDLVVALEPEESTLRGIDALTAMGVVPVLSVRRGGAGPENAPIEALLPVYAHLFHAVRNAKINMGWVRDLTFAVTPLEARFFAGDDARLSVVVQFYRSKIGNMTTRNLARLRRRLRVRRVSDSFDSSHL